MKDESKKIIENDNFLKKYFIHILNIISLLFIVYPFFLASRFNEFNGKTIFSIILEILNVIFVWIEIIYFIIKAAKMKGLKNKAIKIILIYLFSWIYIPVFYMKYIYKGNKSRNSNIVYIIISSLLLLFIFFYISFTVINLTMGNNVDQLSNSSYTYTEKNNIKISVPNNYKKENTGPYDLSFNNGFSTIGLFFYDNINYTSDEILKLQVEDLLSKRENSSLVSEDKYVKDEKMIISQIYKYKHNNNSFIANFSTITFDKRDRYVVYIIQNCPESLYEEIYKNSFKNVLESIQLSD